MNQRELREARLLIIEALTQPDLSPSAAAALRAAAAEGPPCDICGRSVIARLFGAGRPKTRHYECKELAAVMSRLSALLREVRFAEGEAGDKAIKGLRGALQTNLNQELQRLRARRAEGPEDQEPAPFASAEEPSAVLATLEELDRWITLQR